MRTLIRSSFAPFLSVIVGLLGVDAASAADAWIENHLDTMNKHYEVASKRFDDGKVQVHVRQEGADGTKHSVYQFDCMNKVYSPMYLGDAEPDAFPWQSAEPALLPFTLQDGVAPIAKHTCVKHGHPISNW